MTEYTNEITKYTKVRWGDMNENKGFTIKEVIKQYYGDEELYSEYAEEADKILSDLDHESIKEKCLSQAQEKENKFLHIGKFVMSKTACMVAGVCIITILCGFGYAVVSGYIKGIKIKDMEDHSEVEFEYRDSSNYQKTIPILTKIEEYYEPVWIPDGYVKESEYKHDDDYEICYISDEGLIYYHQSLPGFKHHFGAEHGERTEVIIGKYTGYFVESNQGNYLVVHDETYLYCVISEHLDRISMIRMLENDND